MSETLPEEVELKLALGSHGAAQLLRHPALDALPQRRERLTNTYYDTPDGALEAARVALRIRRTTEHTLQTLKTAGSGSGGLSTRGEWEWEIDGDGLDRESLRDLPPMQALDDTLLETLAPRFTTDFERLRWLVEHPDATIEVALDRGEIRAGEHCVAIEELELELKAGDPETLWRLARELAEQVPLRPANVSKAARGAALDRGHWQLPALPEDARARADHATYLLDAFTDTRRPGHLQKAADTYRRLADDHLLDAAVRHHAHALAAALAHPAWLTAAFGQHSLALYQAL
ncbi:CYTH domain-containing protein [Modicisalibacter ilicicola DSM 19980]|uniref:CYTH domain-containing protein n=1 Tax=Modicisalibacter ilicicola DSM 19980 TaxID=1121942 RepID=A0A1M4UVV2_9GAMM|nr:CYTH domain-containing protein [Halomonas ilicicola]SHE60822.1 CYTH domain-containing protein [Halomonas ilicicola DSM 19980]